MNGMKKIDDVTIETCKINQSLQLLQLEKAISCSKFMQVKC